MSITEKEKQKIDDIILSFDWDALLRFFDWQRQSGSGRNKFPTINELSEKARELLYDVCENDLRGKQSGGFKVKRRVFERNQKEVIELSIDYVPFIFRQKREIEF